MSAAPIGPGVRVRLTATALAAVAVAVAAGCDAYEEVPGDPVLDGRRPIAERPLAATARERATLGSR